MFILLRKEIIRVCFSFSFCHPNSETRDDTPRRLFESQIVQPDRSHLRRCRHVVAGDTRGVLPRTAVRGHVCLAERYFVELHGRAVPLPPGPPGQCLPRHRARPGHIATRRSLSNWRRRRDHRPDRRCSVPNNKHGRRPARRMCAAYLG